MILRRGLLFLTLQHTSLCAELHLLLLVTYLVIARLREVFTSECYTVLRFERLELLLFAPQNELACRNDVLATLIFFFLRLGHLMRLNHKSMKNLPLMHVGCNPVSIIRFK